MERGLFLSDNRGRPVEIDAQRVLRFDISTDNLLCKERFDMRLNKPFERSCAVNRVICGVNDMILCCVGDLNLQLLILESLIQIGDQEIYDTVNVFLRERLVEYDLVETVEKFGTEAALQQFGYRLSCFLADLTVLCDTLQNGA